MTVRVISDIPTTASPSQTTGGRRSVVAVTPDPGPGPGSWFNAELVRTITRPVLTIGGAAAWVWFIVAEVNYPPAFQWLIIASWLEWFGERAVKRLAELGGPR